MNIKEMTLYSAPMNSGYTGTILYGRDAIGNVWVFLLGIKHIDGSSYTTGLDRFTLLPEGYRPMTQWVDTAGVFVDNNSCVQNIGARIFMNSPNGELRLYYYKPGTDCAMVSGMICYPAAL